MTSRFYAIEYLDQEGDQVVKHAFLEPEEAQELVKEMAKNGVRGSVNDLSPQPEALPVMSQDEEVQDSEPGH